MAEEKIDSYVDRTGFAADTKFVLEELNRVFEAFKKLDGYKFRLGQTSGLGEVTQIIKESNAEMAKAVEANKKLSESEIKLVQTLKQATQSYSDLAAVAAANEIAQKKLSAAKKQVENDFKSGLITEEQYLKTLSKIKEQQVEFSTSQQQVNLALRNLSKESQAADGSLNELRAQLNLAQQAFDKLSETNRRGETGQALLKNIGDLNQKVSELEQSSGRFQRNVGNYQGSARIIVDALKQVEKELSNLKAKQSELQDFSKRNPIGFQRSGGTEALAQINAQLEETNKQFQVLDKITTNPQFLNIAGKSGDLQNELGFFKKRLNELEDAGLRNSKVYKEVQKRLAELTNQISDTNKEIKSLSSGTRQFDLFAGAVRFAADSFQTFAGAAALAGKNQEDVAKITQTLIAVQSVANGVKGIANELTEKGTAANKAYNFVLEQVRVLFGSATSAAQKFGAALRAIGIAAAIGIIVELVRRFTDTGDAAKKAAAEVEELNRQLQRNKEISESLIKSADFDFRSNIEAIKQYYSQRAALAQSDTDVALLEAEKQRQILDETINFQKERVEAARTQYKNANSDLKAALDEDAKLLDEAKKKIKELGGDPFNVTIDQDFMQQRKKRIELLRKSANEANEALLKEQRDLILIQKQGETQRLEDEAKAAQDRRKQQDDFIKQRAKQLEDDAKKRAEELKKYLEVERRAQRDLLVLRLEGAAELAAAEADISTQNTPRDEALNREFEARKRIVEVVRDFELRSEGITATQRKVIIEQAEKDILNLRIQFLEKSTNARLQSQREENDYILGQVQQLNEDEVKQATEAADKIEKERDRRIRSLSIDQNKELTALNGLYAKGLISKKEYEERKERIENDYTRASLLAQLDYYRQVIKISNLSNDEKEKALVEISRLEKELSHKSLAETEKSEKKKKEARQEALRSIAEEIKGLGFDLVAASYERQKNAIQEQINLLDERTQKEIEAVNQTVASTEEKERRISVIEATAAARRRILEADQRRIDQQKAKFDRTKAIADVVQGTAIAVVNAIKTGNIGLAVLVGALGAIQIARVLATPIPKYKYGKGPGDNYEGPAIWGDGGKPELKLSSDGSMEVSGSTPTLTHVKRDDIILPDAEMAFAMAMRKTEGIRRKADDYFNGPVLNMDLSSVTNTLNKGFSSLSRVIKNKKEIRFVKPSPSQRALMDKIGNKEYFRMNGFDI